MQTKIYHNRDLIGRFTCDGKKPVVSTYRKFKYAMRNGIQVAIVCTFLAGATTGVFTAGKTSTTATFVQAEDKSGEMYDIKVEALKDAVVQDLLDCERSIYGDDDGLVTYDPTDAQFNNNQNKRTIVDKGEMSYGVLQFKKSTVQYYSKLQTGKALTGKEALMIALDKEASSKLAKYIMFSTKGKASGDWKTCANKLNLDSRIDIIKNLEK
jgi:hypothetical protein